MISGIESYKYIILDTNVFMSALIKDSTTRRIILEYDGYFIFPEYIFEELEKHDQEILEKTKLSGKELDKLMHALLKKVLTVPVKVLQPYVEEATSITKNIDVNDVLFIACGLANKNSVIWSDDKKLKLQNRIPILNTKEIMQKMM